MQCSVLVIIVLKPIREVKIPKSTKAIAEIGVANPAGVLIICDLRVADVASRLSEVLHIVVLSRVRLFHIRVHVVVVTTKSILAARSDPRAVSPEQKRNGTAGKSQEGQESTGPLITHPVIHLLGEKHDTSAPERSNKRLGSKC